MICMKQVSTIHWEQGKRGDLAIPYVSFSFARKDKLGHILIEIFMEIDDGGSFNTHNCCFYVHTETGLLDEFKKNLSILKRTQVGNQISFRTGVE